MRFEAKVLNVRKGTRRTIFMLTMKTKDVSEEFIKMWTTGAVAMLELHGMKSLAEKASQVNVVNSTVPESQPIPAA